MRSIAVIGAGLAGLSAAWRLNAAGARVRLIERSKRVGGVVGSHRVEGYLFERGPTTVPAAAPTLRRLIEASGLQDRALFSQPGSQRRYVWRRGRLRSLTAGPLGLLRSDLMSWRGKLRLLAEPFVSRPSESRDETLAEFFHRRLGAEAVDAIADPLVCGVFAGRPHELGVDVFPRLQQWEREHGSLFRAMRRNRTPVSPEDRAQHTSGTDRGLLSFPDGLQELTDAIGRQLGDCIELGSEATSIHRCPDPDQGWRIEICSADGASSPRRITADAVVVAATAPLAARLLESSIPAAADSLRRIPHAPVAVVSLGYERSAVGHPLDGFGLLCASDSPLSSSGPILGVLFSSSIFPDRAPQGSVALTVMLGGTRDPGAVSLADSELVQRAEDACRELLSVEKPAQVASVTRWPLAIPQYLPGHLRRIGELDRLAREAGSLRLAGSYLRGVGVEATASSGIEAAESLLDGYPSTNEL